VPLPKDQNKIKMLLASLGECLATAVMAGCMAVTEDIIGGPCLKVFGALHIS